MKYIRQSFIKDDLIISYSAPSIQAFNSEVEIVNSKAIMYFYYTIEVLYKGKIILEASTHDFPKVIHLSDAINWILTEDNFMLENEFGEAHYFHRLDYYKRLKHIETYEQEYGYLFEVERFKVKQQDEKEYKIWNYYYMTIYEPSKINNKWKTKDISSQVKIEMTKDDLIRLKLVAENFMRLSIDSYNKYDLPDYLEWLEEHSEYKNK